MGLHCLYVRDCKFVKKLGNVYTEAGRGDNVFKRYVLPKDNITVISRMVKTEDDDKLTKITLSNIEFKPIKGLAFSKSFSLYLYYNIKLAIIEIKASDFIVVRLPSFLGVFILVINLVFKRKYFLEVAGDAEDALLASKVKPSIAFRMFAYSFSKLNQYFIMHADGVVYVTQTALQKKYPTKGFTCHASNVDVDIAYKELSLEDYELSNEYFKVGLIGDYNNHYKGINEAIKAIKILTDQGYDIGLHIIGSGSLLQFYKGLAKELKVDNLVNFEGRLKGNDQIAIWLETLDLYIQPSYTEGLPRALIEAMSVGLPAVATDVGGIPELLASEDLVKPYDSKALAKRVEAMLKSKQLRFQKGNSNYQKSKNYDRSFLVKRRSSFWSACRDIVRKDLLKK